MVRKVEVQRRRARAGSTGSGSGILLVSFFLTLTSAWNAQANQGEKTEPAVKVSIGVSVAQPGDLIEVPLTLSGPESLRIGLVRSEISFPRKALSFVAAEPGLAGELSKAQVSAQARNDGRDSELSILEVAVSAPDPMRLGILVYLKFRLSADANKGVLPLKLRDVEVMTESREPLPVERGEDGEVTVFAAEEELPLSACFFYLH